MRQPKKRDGSTPALERALAAARSNGSSDLYIRGDRAAVVETVRTANERDVDVTVHLDGLSGDTLATYARAVCDLAIDVGVPLEFEHRGRTLQLSVRSPRTPRARPDARHGGSRRR